MNEQDLLNSLEALGAQEPGQAPEHVERFLLTQFRRRLRRRRMAAWGSAGVGLVAAGLAVMTWVSRPSSNLWSHVGVGAPALAPNDSAAPRVQEAVVRTDEVASTFYPLPEADGLPPAEDVLVVRVQLPASQLELMGFPIEDDTAPDPVQADVLLGQDGLARGVRLIQ